MIIGLTGSFCAGKDTVAEYLKKRFVHYSLSDAIREEADRQGIKKTRKNLQELGNKLRAKYGNSVLAERALSLFGDMSDYVVSSIRHSAEINVLRKRPDFFLISVEAPSELRFKRMSKRDREEDPKTFKEFLKMEKFESQTKGPGQQLKKCQKMAEIKVINDGDFKQLYAKLDKLIHDLRIQLIKKRPSKDEYYLGIAEAVSRRATCLRRHFGAIIVKDDQIVSSGYCGAARGADNCTDIGKCIREEMKIPSGQRYELCRSVHAEMNAVISAARSGTSVIGGKLYLFGRTVSTGLISGIEPCKLCKRVIINAGLEQVVIKNADGTIQKFDVKDWIKKE